MNNIKSIVAKNLIKLRQANKMTQLELAEKLNYSDKAVSKWEHGDSMPDLAVLVQIADMFGVSLDYLIKEEHSKIDAPFENKRAVKHNRTIIMLVSLLGVWSLALLSFVLISLLFPNISNAWLSFVYAVPATAVVWLVLNSIWFDKKQNFLIISILMWSALACLHLTLRIYGFDVWLAYLLGVPGQIIILLCSFMKRKNK